MSSSRCGTRTCPRRTYPPSPTSEPSGRESRIANLPAGLARRLIVFPMLVDKLFVDFVEEQRPRALVILAHYFALLTMLRGFWWVGDAGPREVLAIVGEVPAEWQHLLSWPLEVMKSDLLSSTYP